MDKNSDQHIIEEQRLQRLLDYDILDTVPEEQYDNIVYIASQICDTPYALLSLIDGTRVWFKAKYGLAAHQGDRNGSFCSHVIDDDAVDVFVVKDASQDPRFSNHAWVTGEPHIRFYAGVPLLTPSDGYRIGALCVMDKEARTLEPQQIETLKALARTVMTHLELKLAFTDLVEREHSLNNYRRDMKKKLLDKIIQDTESIQAADDLDE